ncbi:hypothetical protein T4E_11694 [Trichinella pseudospiralis]|uniref:Uncharacterized protein n=1 Tax=Trichinella pseudospiralis TaxID=6337 RepID=A0A0V0WWT3_TRIPS|nr:hypothetical protein T4E_11694 [Trichinella pseudospiralis]
MNWKNQNKCRGELIHFATTTNSIRESPKGLAVLCSALIHI